MSGWCASSISARGSAVFLVDPAAGWSAVVSAPAAIVLLGPSGLDVARRIAAAMPDSSCTGHRVGSRRIPRSCGIQDFPSTLRDLFTAGRAVVALCSSGIVIRILAPLLQDKRTEPPVVIVAEDGSVVVPLLGGHRGANRLAEQIAGILGCPAAITTAGDVRFGLALDDPPPGWHVQNPETAKPIMSALLRGQDVGLKVEAAPPGWLTAGGAPCQPRGARGPHHRSRRSRIGHPSGHSPQGARSWRRLRARHGGGGASGTGGFDPRRAWFRRRGDRLRGVARHQGGRAGDPQPCGAARRAARFFPASQLEAERERLAKPSSEVFAVTGCHGVAEGAALAAVGAAGSWSSPRPSRPAPLARLRARPCRSIPPGSAEPGTPRSRRAGSRRFRLADPGGERIARRRRGLGRLRRLPSASRSRTAQSRGPPCFRARRGRSAGAPRPGSGRGGAPRRADQLGRPRHLRHGGLVLELLERGDPEWQRVAVMVSPGVSALQAAAARAGAPLGHDFAPSHCPIC